MLRISPTARPYRFLRRAKGRAVGGFLEIEIPPAVTFGGLTYLQNLIGVEKVMGFVQTILYTGRIKGANPVSALLISQPECGKTTTVTNALLDGKCKSAVALTDVTGRGLAELCKQHPEVSHFIFNDLVTIMSHRDTVNRYTLSIIQAMTEEGLSAMAFPGKIETFEHGRRGIIACSTPGMVKDKRGWWNRHGLASRMLPFFYDHPEPLSIRIKDAIESDGKTQLEIPPRKKVPKSIMLHVPEKHIGVSIPRELGDEIRSLSDHRAHVLGDPKGYRRLKQYRTVAKAHALTRGEKFKNASVSRADVDWLRQIDRYISYTEATML